MIKLCAQAMGLHFGDLPYQRNVAADYDGPRVTYDPLHNDEPAMALVKKFGLTIDPQEDAPPYTWRVVVANDGDWDDQIFSQGPDLNRAIVECVAKLQAKVAA